MKIHLIAAARPNFMKIAPLYHALKKESWAEPKIVHTGQHYDALMSDVLIQELGMPIPDIQLNVGSGSHGGQTARMLEGIEQAAQEIKPCCILVYGDTNSTLAGAMVGAKLGIPVNLRSSPVVNVSPIWIVP